MRRRLLTSIYTALAFMASAQVSVKVVDSKSDEPVEFALVIFENATEKSQATTNVEGVATSQLEPPLSITVSHVSFENHTEVVTGNASTIRVEATITSLDNIVIETDPYRTTAINRELYEVKEINRKTIDQLGGNNLADVLNFHMNINITPDASTGRSTISMFGLDDEYVKVLVDNVPMAGDNSSGNDIDITQIGLDNVERIEVSEGSMGVMYGPNAVAGVVNIVTKKGSSHKWKLNASVQEETVGDEYAFFDQGRHIQNISLGHNFSEKLYVNAGYRRNDFKGFLNGYQGRDHTVSSDELNKERGYEWSPKLQNNFNAVANYQLNDRFAGYYKFDYYDEELHIYDKIVTNGLNSLSGKTESTARDQLFLTNRMSHQLNLNGKLTDNLAVNALLSYQYQERENEEYTYNITRSIKTESDGLLKDQSSEIYFSKITLDGHLPNVESMTFTIGYEGESQEGYDAIAGGNYSDTIGIRTLSYNDLFANVYLFKDANFKLTPGARLNTNSNYGTYLIWSLNTKYEFFNDLSTSLIVGSAYKTPNFNQLFYYFVDANHNVTGNPDLTPEDGISLVWVTTKAHSVGKTGFKHVIRGYHFDIRDKISSALIEEADPDSPTDIQRTTYLNLDEFKNLGVSFENSVTTKRLNVSLGVEYMGIKQTYVEDESEPYDDEYLFRFNAQSQLAYDFHDLDATFAANYKYTGGGDRYFETEGEVYKGYIDGFGLLDASFTKYLSDRTITAQFGARNVLNVVNVNATGIPGGAHGASGPNAVLFANGRSYFVKLAYNLDFN